MADYLFFDLDGTLTDPCEGITNSILHALERMGKDKPERSLLQRFIGPPLTGSFRSFLGMTEEEADTALRYYREVYSVTGLFENEVYPGIPEALGKLRYPAKKDACDKAKRQPENFSFQGCPVLWI